jgi:hypothetical protein
MGNEPTPFARNIGFAPGETQRDERVSGFNTTGKSSTKESLTASASGATDVGENTPGPNAESFKIVKRLDKILDEFRNH